MSKRRRRRARQHQKAAPPAAPPPEAPSNSGSTAGVGGYVIHGGRLASDELDARLRELARYKTYRDMLYNTSIVAAGVRYFLNLVSKAAWTAKPSTLPGVDEALAEEHAKFAQSAIDNVRLRSWHRVIRAGAMYRFYGFSIQEWTAERRATDGKIVFRDIAPRPQRTITEWYQNERQEVIGVGQEPPDFGKTIKLPRAKLLYLVDDSLEDSPEGLGLFRHITGRCTLLRRYEDLEKIGFETDLRGIPIVRAPLADLQEKVRNGTMTQADYDKAVQPLVDFLTNHVRGPKLGMMLDSLTYKTADERNAPSAQHKWDIELLKAGSTSQEAIANAIVRLTHDIARLLGVENLLLGADGKGSLALSADKSHNFFLLIDSTLTDMRAGLRRDVLGPLWALNGLPEETMPTFETEAIQYRDIQSVTGALRDLAVAGAPMDYKDEAIDAVRQLVGLPPSTGLPPLGAQQPGTADATLFGDGDQEGNPNE